MALCARSLYHTFKFIVYLNFKGKKVNKTKTSCLDFFTCFILCYIWKINFCNGTMFFSDFFPLLFEKNFDFERVCWTCEIVYLNLVAAELLFYILWPIVKWRLHLVEFCYQRFAPLKLMKGDITLVMLRKFAART